jgi:hypothetical protein
MNIQEFTQKLRQEVDISSKQDNHTLDGLFRNLKQRVDSGEIDIHDVEDVMRDMFGVELEEMSTTGGVGAYNPGLDVPAKKYKEPYLKESDSTMSSKSEKELETVEVGEIGSTKAVKKGDKIYYRGFPVTIEKLFKNTSAQPSKEQGKVFITVKGEEGESITDLASRFKINPPKQSEVKDVEPKLAAGKIKKDYAVTHFGFEEAPSIPNRPSKGGFQYKDLWGLNESYSRFKKETSTRSNTQQYHEGIKLVRKELGKVNTIMEYLKKLKESLNDDGELRESRHTLKALEQLKERIKSVYVKAKTL